MGVLGALPGAAGAAASVIVIRRSAAGSSSIRSFGAHQFIVLVAAFRQVDCVHHEYHLSDTVVL